MLARKIHLFISGLMFLLCSVSIEGQTPFHLDTSFCVDMDGDIQWYRGYISDFFEEEDGSIIIVGNFYHYFNDQKPRAMAKLTPNGIIDHSFNYTHPYSNWSGNTRITKYQGMYYVGCQPNPGVLRVFPDGTIDTSFRFPMDSFFGHSVAVTDIHLRTDGKVMVSGLFMINASGGYGLLRLNQDGSLDTTFHSPFVDKYLNFILPLADGKYLIGGVKYDMQKTRSSVWRIHPDGELDTTFNTGSIDRGCFYADTVAGTDKFIVTGELIIPGFPSPITFARLNNDGSIDTTFFYLNNFDHNLLSGCAGPFLFFGDKLLLGGGYHSINGRPYNCLAVFDTNGILDTLLSAGLPGPDISAPYYKYPDISTFGLQGSKILVRGGFNSFEGFSSFCLVRLHGLTAGLNEVAKSGSMHCFPNPVSGEVNIRVEQALSGTYRLLDMSGRLLFSGVLYPAQKHHRISLPTLAPGLYLLQLSSKDGKEYCEKLVVR